MNSSEVRSNAIKIEMLSAVVDVVRLSSGCERIVCNRDGPALRVRLAQRQMTMLKLFKVQQQCLESQPHKSKRKIKLL